MGNKAGKKVVDLISSATPRGNRGVEAAGTSDSARFYKSNGLYATCAWDERVVRKMIADKKLAPRYPGVGKPEDGHEECPICFLYYPGGLNRSKCCKQSICSECFLQVKLPGAQPSSCPFCNADRFSVRFRGPLSDRERRVIEEEEQRVVEAQIRMQQSEDADAAERKKAWLAEHGDGGGAGEAEPEASPSRVTSPATPRRAGGAISSTGRDSVDDETTPVRTVPREELPIRSAEEYFRTPPREGTAAFEAANRRPDPVAHQHAVPMGGMPIHFAAEMARRLGGEVNVADLEELLIQEAMRRSVAEQEAADRAAEDAAERQRAERQAAARDRGDSSSVDHDDVRLSMGGGDGASDDPDGDEQERLDMELAIRLSLADSGSGDD